MDVLRLVFALLVILSHAPVMVDGNESREYFVRFTQPGVTHGEITLGGVAVLGFFLLSGSLIVRSWMSDPNLLRYLRKRVLRIVPGFLVAALLSTLVVGLIAPDGPHFFQRLGKPFAVSLVTLNRPDTPSVFPGTSIEVVNGSLWTIAYEFRCYLFVALMGVLGLLRRRYLWLSLTIVCNVMVMMPWLHQRAD